MRVSCAADVRAGEVALMRTSCATDVRAGEVALMRVGRLR